MLKLAIVIKMKKLKHLSSAKIKKLYNFSLAFLLILAIFSPQFVHAQAGEEPDRAGGGQQARTSTTGRIEGTCKTLSRDECPIIDYIAIFINLLGAAVGTIVVIVIVFGGVQYASARDNPQAVAAARQRITNALIALALYMAMLGFLQWLVPGGVIGI